MIRRWWLGVLLVLCLPAAGWAFNAGSGCVKCHRDRALFAKLGAPGMSLDPAAVDREVNMDGQPTCVDCHLGNPATMDPKAAHKGMLRPFLVAFGPKLAGRAVPRSAVGLRPLQVKGQTPGALLPKPDAKLAAKLAAKAGITRIGTMLWQDRDPKTFAYDPKIARKTCGKCHARETRDYDVSGMGLARFQRANRSFSEPLPGPHNCGPWFGDNYKRLAAETSVPFSKAQNGADARSCQVCHASCDDCHYKPYKGKGRHLFGRPEALSCYGGRRGVICHAGPMERRRGAGYMRDEYAFPGTLFTGVHKMEGVSCLDCHAFHDHDAGQMASAETRASCSKCHPEIVKAVAASDHAKVDCASCHVDETGGYQFTAWGPGKFFGLKTPYAKHAGYVGVRNLPTLIRNPEGRWLPYKPYPMVALNQKNALPAGKVTYRAIPRRIIAGNVGIGEPKSFTVERTASQTNDAYIPAGSRTDLPGGRRAILWIQMDKISHALSVARNCKTCHASHAQRAVSNFRFFDTRYVTAPVIASYKVVADKQGLRFEDFKYTPIKPAAGVSVADFAPFVDFPKTAWDVKGIDFSIPFNKQKYDRAAADLKTFLAKVDAALASAREKKRKNGLAQVKAVAYHNLAMAQAMFKTLP